MKSVVKGVLLFAALLIIIFSSLSLGTVIISPAEMMDIFISQKATIGRNIVLLIRIPRLFMTVVIGASLAVSGTVFQAVLKNPLADPYIIGVSGGAALGATVSILLSANYVIVALTAFAGGIAAITLVYLLSKRMSLGSTALILSGIALGFILSSAVLLLFALSESEDVHKALMWLMGDLSIARYSMLSSMGVLSVILILCTMLFHKHLDVISFGSRFSKKLGVTEQTIRLLFWMAAMLSAISVSIAGVIGFVGLIVPHVMRNIFGPNHLRLIPLAAAGGALFLLLSDTISRSAVPPYEIPVGIITTFFGGIFFLIYMIKKGAVKE